MNEYEIILTDVAKGIRVETTTVDAKTSGVGDNLWHIDNYTLRGGRSDGVDVIVCDDGRFRLDRLPTRGMGLWRGWFDTL